MSSSGLPLPAGFRDDRVQIRQPTADGPADVPRGSLEREEPRDRASLLEHGDLHIATNFTDRLSELGRQKRIVQQRLRLRELYPAVCQFRGESPPGQQFHLHSQDRNPQVEWPGDRMPLLL